MPLLGHNGFVIPISAFDQANCQASLALTRPGDSVEQVGLAVAEVGLQGQTARGRAGEFRIGENRLEDAQGKVFKDVALHVEIDEGAELFGETENRAESGGDVFDSALRIGRLNLRVEGGEFDRDV